MIECGASPASDATVISCAPGARVAYPKGQPVELCPWIRTEALETHVIINDLVHSLARNVGPVSDYWERRLDNWTGMERVVDQYAADGTLLARYSKQLASDEVWRLSLGRAREPSLEYGLLVFTGPYTLCHFQIVGPQTFATCHSRRFPLLEPAGPHLRGIPVQLEPGLLLSLFFVNRGERTNRITLSRPVCAGRIEEATVTVSPLGCRIVCLNQLFAGLEEGKLYERVSVKSTYPYDFYTIAENGRAGGEAFSIQHIK